MQVPSDSYGDDGQRVPPPWAASVDVDGPLRVAPGRFFFARIAGGRDVS
jgi:hypothetical protein